MRTRHDLLLGQAQLLIGGNYPDVDIRVNLEEVRDDRHENDTPEAERRRHGKLACRCGILTGRGTLCFGHIRENALAGRNIGSARIGQHQAPARSVEEFCAQVKFKLGHVSADGRERRFQSPCRRGQAAVLDHGQKGRHRFQSIHRIPLP